MRFATFDGSGFVRLGRSLRSLPSFTPAHFCGCWNAFHSFVAIAKTLFTAETFNANAFSK